jgi:protein-L-isoaspartate(D-aspartate) O-methyltransferase
VAQEDVKKKLGPAKPEKPGLRIGTRVTETAAPNLQPKWGAKASANVPASSTLSSPRHLARKANTTWQNTGLSSDRTRARMVERLIEQGIKNQRVLAAMRQVPRHQFMDEALASRAYEDTALPIGHNQTISQPYVVARVIELALGLVSGEPRPLKALEVGGGCGYQAAVMSHCFERVVSVERIKALADLAKVNLRPLRRSNLKFVYGDGLVAAAEDAPFDVILCSAGMGQLAQELVSQLAIGGVLVAPIGEPQRLTAVQRISEDEYKTQGFDMVRYVPVIRGTQ